MNLTAETIFGFTTSLLLSRFDSPKPTPAFHWELWDLVTKEDKQIAIAAPRGHAKSTAITHAFVLACMLFRERDFALVVSDTEGQAVQFLGDIKKELQENEELIATFGVDRFVKDTESDIIVQLKDGDQFRIIAKGSEQKVRGLKWRNKRPNLIVGDDLENDEIVMNEDRRFKFRQWFFNALVPCGSDDCIIRIVGTVLHMDSLLERLMPPWGEVTTHTDGVKHWTDKKRSWVSIRYQAHNEDFTKMLWPEKFSKERLLSIRQTYVEQGFPEGYSQEYLNYPIDEENAYFHIGDFIPITDFEEHMEFYVGCDLAISEKDSRAYTVFVVVGVTATGVLKVVDVRRFRGDGLAIIDELFAVNARYKPELIIIEKENIARSIGAFLDAEMIKRGVYLNLDTPVPSQDKVKRARSIQMRMRGGQVQFDTEADWYPALVTEMTQFPRGVYKDQVDALAHIGLALDKIVDAPTSAELEDQYWDEADEDNDFYEMTVDPHTGY